MRNPFIFQLKKLEKYQVRWDVKHHASYRPYTANNEFAEDQAEKEWYALPVQPQSAYFEDSIFYCPTDEYGRPEYVH